jgi:hypothetical protein
MDVQLLKTPLNPETPIFLAAHGSHKSHGSHASHGSHRSSSSSSSKSGSARSSSPVTTERAVTSYPPKESCPDHLLSSRKNVVRQVQYHLVLSGDLDLTAAIGSLGVIDYDTRIAISSFQIQKGITKVSGTTLDNITLNSMGISCY